MLFLAPAFDKLGLVLSRRIGAGRLTGLGSFGDSISPRVVEACGVGYRKRPCPGPRARAFHPDGEVAERLKAAVC